MGANSSQFQDSHIRIYKKLLALRSPQSRLQIIQTLLAGPEYVDAAKRAGVYSHLLTYIARVRSGEVPGPLPWEAAVAYEAQAQPAAGGGGKQLTQYVEPRTAAGHQHIVLRGEQKGEKAHNYFQSCLLVLALEEEVALTEETLRTAYKRAAVRSHPDKKGGSEEAFEAVSRAYAYLGDILLRIQGGRKKAGKVEAPSVLNENRIDDSREWQHVEPVKLNPKNLDMNVFNQMFEQNRIPDPEAEGYGDWLKGAGAGASQGPTFGGKFNRDVFNKTFEDDARTRAGGAGTGLQVLTPDALTMAPGMGTQIGRTYTGDYTAAANASMKYTDLKKAYTTENVFSHQVAGVRPEQRNLEQYSAARKRAPDPLSDREMEAISEAEHHAARAEQQRQLRAAQEGRIESQHFERMKRLILMDTKP